MATQAPPQSANRYYAASAYAASTAAAQALQARPRGLRAVWMAVATFQTAQGQLAESAVALMLAEQDIVAEAEALLRSSAFTTSQSDLTARLESIETDAQFFRLVESLVQDAGRAAEGVAVAARPQIGHVRMLTPPSCSRCAVLAGRVYRYSTGFLRHPGCDCVMVPTTLANTSYNQDPVDLMRRGLVTGLSKADQQAVADGADFARVVNVRSREAGMSESGRVLYRRGRMTPEAIYRSTGDDREAALDLLQQAGYLR